MIYYETELYHHGILGMKWGVRRYQNKDGTRTSLGKKREHQEYVREKNTVNLSQYKEINKQTKAANKQERKEKLSKWTDQTIKGGKDKPNKSPVQVVTKESENIIGNAADILEAASKFKKRSNKAEGMSSEELRERIKRIKLENEYNDLTRDSTNIDRAMNALQILGSAAAIAASAATVVAVVKAVK